jgi:hypothetical protein
MNGWKGGRVDGKKVVEERGCKQKRKEEEGICRQASEARLPILWLHPT